MQRLCNFVMESDKIMQLVNVTVF